MTDLKLVSLQLFVPDIPSNVIIGDVHYSSVRGPLATHSRRGEVIYGDERHAQAA
jgi:hypothetical protein